MNVNQQNRAKIGLYDDLKSLDGFDTGSLITVYSVQFQGFKHGIVDCVIGDTVGKQCVLVNWFGDNESMIKKPLYTEDRIEGDIWEYT